jgi:hypothetical protein
MIDRIACFLSADVMRVVDWFEELRRLVPTD